MTLPNFLLIGAPKCGTTSVYHYLRQHPQVYLSPVKEPMFFVLEGSEQERAPRPDVAYKTPVHDIETYLALFDGVDDEVAIGEASIQYLYSSRAPDRIREHIPDVKLIAVLRDPVERAYSSYVMSVRNGRETLDFGAAVEAELNRREEELRWWEKRNNVEVGFYHRHLSRYYERFDSARIGVFLYDDLAADPAALMRDLFGFLGVDSSFAPDLGIRHLPAGLPRGPLGRAFLALTRHPLKERLKDRLPERLRHRLARWAERRVMAAPPAMEPDVEAKLRELYRADTLALEDLIQRDLSRWREA